MKHLTLKLYLCVSLFWTIQLWNFKFVVAQPHPNESDLISTSPVAYNYNYYTGSIYDELESDVFKIGDDVVHSVVTSSRSTTEQTVSLRKRRRKKRKNPKNPKKEVLIPKFEDLLWDKYEEVLEQDTGDGSGDVDNYNTSTEYAATFPSSEYPTTVTSSNQITRLPTDVVTALRVTTDLPLFTKQLSTESIPLSETSLITETTEATSSDSIYDFLNTTFELNTESDITTEQTDVTQLPHTTQTSATPKCPEQLEKLYFPGQFITDNQFLAKWAFKCYIRNITYNVTYSYNMFGNEDDLQVVQTFTKNITISGLRAFTSYDVCVCAIVYGKADTCHFTCGKVTTKVGRPDHPENLTVVDIGASWINVRWDPPVRYAGPTRYNVHLISGANVSATFQNVSVANVTNLMPFTNYCLSVEAETENGVNATMGFCYMTKPGVPSEVQNFHGSCKVVECSLFWTLPEVISGYLDYYYLTYRGFRTSNNRIDNGSQIVLQFTGNHVQVVVAKLMADSNYKFTVQAKTKEVSTLGKPSSIDMNTHAGIPKFTHKPADIFTDSSVNAHYEIKINLTKGLFSDEYGDITYYALIVAQSSKAEGRQRGSKDSGYFFTWSQVKNEDKILPYVTTPHDWNPYRRYGNSVYDSIIYVIGNDSDCFKNSNLLERCNGPLRPGTSYSVKIRAYTSGGYVDSPILNFKTDSNNAILVMCIFSLLLFMLAVFTVAMWLKRKNIVLKFVTIKRCEKNQKCVPSDDAIPIKATAKPILLSNFCNHFEVMSSDSGLKFSKEFEELHGVSSTASTNVAQFPENKAKNRWINILPFDESRVKLLPIPDDVSTDYINASYIPGFRSPREYIATQGPLSTTKDDFWRMVWEQSSPMIVMVTQCVERGKVKCEEYWPSDQDKHYYGDLAVKLKSESILRGFTIRIFDLELGTRVMEVKQMHFTTWPDFGCPASTTLLLNFVRTVRDHIPRGYNGPIIVHCSAGVGRTGTFIAVDHLIQHVAHYDFVDVYGIVHNMRQYRTNMVQTEDQYVYIHECIRDILHNQHSL